MLLLLSPAKTLYEQFPVLPTGAKKIESALREPVFFEQSKQLIAELQTKSPEEIQKLMKVSEKIADLNIGRYKNFPHTLNKSNSYPALTCFMGDVYRPILTEKFSLQDWVFAQDHVCSLSGLYGLLRPLDLMYPYRLEMGTKFVIDTPSIQAPNLYEFWDDQLTNYLNKYLAVKKISTVVNLASQEYFKVIRPKQLTAKLLTIDFKNYDKKGALKTIAIYAKKARGMMTQWIIKNKITTVEDLKKFPDYQYDPAYSTDDRWVFIR